MTNRARTFFSLVALLALGTTGTAVTTTTLGCDVVNDAADALNIPIEFDHTVNFGADIGQVTGRAAGQPSPEAASFPIETGAVPVDLISQSSELAANREKVRRLELTEITVRPTSNTLTSASPPLDLYIGPKGATTKDQGVRIATIPSIPAGSTTAVSATIVAAGIDAAQQHLLTFDFVVIPAGTLSVAAGETVPDGAMDLALTLGVKAVLNPTK